MLWFQAPQPLHDDVIKGIVTGSVGLVTSLIPVIVGWWKDRGASARRSRHLDDAAKRVSFWDVWLKAISPLDLDESVSERKEFAKAEFLAIANDIKILFALDTPSQKHERATNFENERVEMPRWKRWLLLYKPPRARAWFPRFFFYLFALQALTYLPVIVPWQKSEMKQLERQISRDMSLNVPQQGLREDLPQIGRPDAG